MYRYFILALLLVGMGTLVSLHCVAQSRGEEVSPPTALLMDKVEKKAWLLIDVRSPQEFAQGHIPGAINIPHDQIAGYVKRLEDYKHKPVVLYCQSGRRARLAMQTLAEHEFTDLRHLEGDMLGWYESGQPIEKM